MLHSTLVPVRQEQAVGGRALAFFVTLYVGIMSRFNAIMRNIEKRQAEDRERGSHTTDVLLWALAIIVIVGIAVLALTTYVTRKGDELQGQP